MFFFSFSLFIKKLFRTVENLKAGSIMSVLNIVMQLRKCCNHPNLFESRPVLSPFIIRPLEISFPRDVLSIQREERVDLLTILPNLIGSRNASLLLSRISTDDVLQKVSSGTPFPRMPKIPGFKFTTTKAQTDRAKQGLESNINGQLQLSSVEDSGTPSHGSFGQVKLIVQPDGKKVIAIKRRSEDQNGFEMVKDGDITAPLVVPVNGDITVDSVLGKAVKIDGKTRKRTEVKQLKASNSMKTSLRNYHTEPDANVPSTSGIASENSVSELKSDELSPSEKKFKPASMAEIIPPKIPLSVKKEMRRKQFLSIVHRFAQLRRLLPVPLISEELCAAVSIFENPISTSLDEDLLLPLYGVEKIQAKILKNLWKFIEDASRK